MTAETQPLLQKAPGGPPLAPWATALASSRDASRRLPQAIAHRGAKALFPENTMAAYKGAVEVGSHALEADVHLSADGVVVMSHDPDLKRCFGEEARVADCKWEYLSTLRTVNAPHEPMPRFKDLLEFLAEPGQEKIWIVLDIKIDDDADELVGAIARTLAEVSSPVPWEKRIVLGCWNATFLKAAHRLLPDYPLAHISASRLYSRHFFSVANLGFNLHYMALAGLGGRRFMRDARAANKLLVTWTVNEPRWMEWCIRQNLQVAELEPEPKPGAAGSDSGLKPTLLDGVITDDPRLYLDVCRRVEDELDGVATPKAALGLFAWLRQGFRSACMSVTYRALIMAYFIVLRMKGKFDYLKKRGSLDE